MFTALFVATSITFMLTRQAVVPINVGVLSTRGSQSLFTIYHVAKGSLQKQHSFLLQSVEAEQREQLPHSHEVLNTVWFQDVVVSPKSRYFACNYVRSRQKPTSIIRVYDLHTGKMIREIKPTNDTRIFEYCTWIDEQTLQYNELYSLKGGAGYLTRDIKVYSVSTNAFRLVHTEQSRYYLAPNPGAYALRAGNASIALNAIHVSPPLGEGTGLFTSNLLGVYHGCSHGAVSEDGKFVIAESSDKPGRFYVLLENNQKLGELTWPKQARIKRLKFVDELLMVAIEQNGAGTVQVWSLHPLQQIGAIKGDVIAD